MRSFYLVFLSFAIFLTFQSSAADGKQPTVGINYVSLLWEAWGTSPFGPADGTSTAVQHIKEACARNITPHIRFAATPFWPVDFNRSGYFTDRPAFWSRVRTVLRDVLSVCPKGTMTLIPSLFWNWWTVPDLSHEPLGEMMRAPSSSSRRFFVQYVREFFSEGIPGGGDGGGNVIIELGNELSLLADLNLSTSKTHPSLGQPSHRTMADNFSTSDMVVFEEWLAAVIHQNVGANLRISTGHSTPRSDAHHLRQSYHAPQRDWTSDTKEQFEQNLRDTCACCEICSMHYYSQTPQHRPWVSGNSLLEVAYGAVVRGETQKQLYLGEFGDPQPGPRPFSHGVLNTLRSIGGGASSSRSQLFATIWIWSFYQFSKTDPAPFSLVPGRDDAMIEDMQKFNRGH